MKLDTILFFFYHSLIFFAPRFFQIVFSHKHYWLFCRLSPDSAPWRILVVWSGKKRRDYLRFANVIVWLALCFTFYLSARLNCWYRTGSSGSHRERLTGHLFWTCHESIISPFFFVRRLSGLLANCYFDPSRKQILRVEFWSSEFHLQTW